MSVFVDPMIDGLGLTRAQVSGAYLVGTLVGAVTLPLVGRWIDRLGVRLVMLAVGAGFGAVLLGMGGVVGLVSLTLGFTGIRLLGQGSLTLVSTTAVALWFDRRRGLAIGLSTAIGGALLSLSPLVLSIGIDRLDWRQTWVVAGIVIWAIVVPIAWFGMRDSPAALGQHLDGEAPRGSEAEVADAAARRSAAAWTRGEAVRTGMFWAVTGAVIASGMITTGLAFHQISLLGERGLSVAQAAANFLPQTAAGIGATLAMGVLVDRIAPRWLIAASMGSMALALVLAQTAAPGLRAIAFGIAVGAAAGALRALEAAALPRYFGLEHLGAIRGLVMALNVAGTALGPFVFALGFARYGSYNPVLSGLIAIPVAIALATLFARVPDADLRARVRARGGAG